MRHEPHSTFAGVQLLQKMPPSGCLIKFIGLQALYSTAGIGNITEAGLMVSLSEANDSRYIGRMESLMRHHRKGRHSGSTRGAEVHSRS
jgi:hypothetical protein